MKKTLITVTVLMLTTISGAAQQTYAELYEKGALGDINHMEEQIGKLLEANGVSEDCVGKLTLSDVTNINLVIGGGDSEPEKVQRVKMILNEKCS